MRIGIIKKEERRMKLEKTRKREGWKIEITDGDRSVSRLWISDLQMHIGRCPVRTGGIGGVGTDPEYRRRGLARRLLEAALELMEEEGFDASFLFGIQDFYHRFGFVTCMAEPRIHLDTRALEQGLKTLGSEERPCMRTRPMKDRKSHV